MKIVKKHVKQAVLLYIDPDTGIYRRVVFGEPEETLNFFLDNVAILMTRFEAIYEQGDPAKVKKPNKFLEMIKKSRRPWEQENAAETAEDMEMDLTYEVREVKNGKLKTKGGK